MTVQLPLHSDANIIMFARSTAFTVPDARDGGVNDVAIGPPSSMSAFAIVVAAACENGTVVGFDERAPSEGRCAFEVSTTTGRRRRDDDDEANCVVWGVDGSSSLYFARGSTVFETDVRRLGCGDDASAAVIRTFDEASDGVNGVDIDAKGELLAACDDDGGIVVYDLKSGGVRRRLKGHTGCVTSVRFRRGKRGSGECVSAATDCRVMKWDVGSKPVPVRTWETRAMRGVDDLIREESVAKDDGDNDKGTEKDASDSARAFNPPMAHSVAVFDGVASDENVPGARRVLATACGDGTIAVIDMDHPGCGSGGSKKKKSASTGVFRSGKAECVRLGASDLATSAVHPSIRHTAAATCAEFAPWNPRGDIIVSGGTDRRLIAWNWVSAASASATSASSASTGAIASVKRSRKINALAFAHASPRLAVADTGPSIAVYDVGS